MSGIIEKIVAWALVLAKTYSYLGIFLTMMLESAAIPIPSEVVLPFGGFLASQGNINLVILVVVATVANLVGASIIYWIGYAFGRKVLEKYGKYVLIHNTEIERMDNWLDKHGAGVAFFSRLIPGVRTFSSLVIGEAKISFKKFLTYTFLGSLIWNFPLSYAGYVAGEHWDYLHPYFQKFEFIILGIIAIGIIFFIFRHVRKNNYRKLES